MLQKKDTKSNNLKYFTDLLFKNNDIINDKLENNSEFSNFKFRIINMLVNHPKLLWYINKYLNNFYQHSNVNWFYSLKSLIQIYGIKSKGDLIFTKFKISDRKLFKSVLLENYSNLNSNDLNELYRLYLSSIISTDDFQKLKSNYTDKAINLKKNFISNEKKATVQPEIQKHTFNENALSFLKSRKKCQSCKYFSTNKLFIDGNTNNLTDINIVFINDASPSSDINEGNIFFNNDLKLQFTKLKINYLVINILPCDVKLINDTKLFKTVSEDCRDLTNMLLNSITCKSRVLIGQRVKNWFGYKTKLSNIRMDDYFLLTSPKENEEEFKVGFQIVMKEVLKSITKINNFENSISKEDPNLTLFDIKIVGEKLLYIFCDKFNNKQYFVETIQFPIYVKQGQYSDCEYISGDMTFETNLTNIEKRKISNTMYERLNSEVLKNVVSN